MKLVNEKLGVNAELKENFSQAEFEKYQNELIAATDNQKANSVVSRALVQAAINAGILKGIDKPLPDMAPRVIRWLTLKVNDFINLETEVPQD